MVYSVNVKTVDSHKLQGFAQQLERLIGYTNGLQVSRHPAVIGLEISDHIAHVLCSCRHIPLIARLLLALEILLGECIVFDDRFFFDPNCAQNQRCNLSGAVFSADAVNDSTSTWFVCDLLDNAADLRLTMFKREDVDTAEIGRILHSLAQPVILVTHERQMIVG